LGFTRILVGILPLVGNAINAPAPRRMGGKERDGAMTRTRGEVQRVPKVPKKLSAGEEAFALQCRADGLDPLREYVFHPTRKWRFDFYFPERKLAVEIEGGIWSGGRHSRGAGFESDCYKYNMAAKMRIRVLRYSIGMVMSGQAIQDVLEMLK
jgi:very-short-patch-repair endonuclease